jgi:hypothetical protein
MILFVCGQVRFYVFRIATEEVNPNCDHNVQIYDSRACALPFAFRCPSQLARSSSVRNNFSGAWAGNQVDRKRFYLELRQLQDRNFGRVVHCFQLYRIAV